MPTIKAILKNKLAGAEKAAILAIGSELRGDDIAAILVAEELKKYKRGHDGLNLKVFIGSTAPENLTGEIKKFRPTHLIIIDTAEMKQRPGTILVLNPENIGEGASFSTHKIPAKILIDYFLKSLKCDITVIGIQPASVVFGNAVSNDVTESAKEIASAVAEAAGWKKVK